MSGTKTAPEAFLEIRGLKKYFGVHGGLLHAVDDVSLSIGRGRTLGLVGESGCGKSTLGRVVIGLIEATGGEVLFDGQDSLKFTGAKRSKFRRRAQIVFQDPFSSLNPRMSVSQLIAEPLVINRACPHRELDARVKKLMDTVGLASRLITSFPHELDGGRRQRIGIARALMLKPEFILCDEPIAALDASIQAQVVNMLQDLQEEFHFTYLFISHDLSMMRYISSRIGVMYLGSLAELAPSRELYERPLHPYTRALLSARPVADPEKARAIKRLPLSMELPSPLDSLPGCPFAPRCPFAKPLCREEKPALRELSPAHFVSCLRADEISRESS